MRTTFKVIGAVWLVAIVVLGIGGAYLQRHGGGAGQLAEGIADAREELAEIREMEREHRSGRNMAQARDKYRQLREAGWGHEAAAQSAGLPTDSAPSITVE